MSKVMIAIPCMDYLEANFVECLTDMMMYNFKRGIDAVPVLLKSSLVYDARNQASQKAVAEGFDFVLWIDSDMTFEPNLLETMLNEIGDKPMLSGLCFGRKPPFKPCIFDDISATQEGLGITPHATNWYDYPRDTITEVAGCGFACVLQRVDMLDVMLAMYGVPFFPIAGLGEDLSFCYRAAKLDYKMYADTSLKIGHLMRIAVDENFRDNVFMGAEKSAT